jgi:hypothetical protein
MRDAAAGVIGDAGAAGAAGVEVFVFISVLSEKYVPKAARRYPPASTDFDHDMAPNDFQDFLLQLSDACISSDCRCFGCGFAESVAGHPMNLSDHSQPEPAVHALMP